MTAQATSDVNIFQKLDQYPWESDEDFQSGLDAILGSDASQEEAEHLSLQAKCFYYARKHDVAIDFDAYQDWRCQHPSKLKSSEKCPSSLITHSPSTNATFDDSVVSKDKAPSSGAPPASAETAPYPTSFNQIVDLITTGQPIPGVKDIPNTTLSGQESQPTTAKRKKPWEKLDQQTQGVVADIQM